MGMFIATAARHIASHTHYSYQPVFTLIVLGLLLEVRPHKLTLNLLPLKADVRKQWDGCFTSDKAFLLLRDFEVSLREAARATVRGFI